MTTTNAMISGLIVGLASSALAGQATSPAGPTYHRDVAPILHKQCAECHREGEVAPFSLLKYEDAAKRAEFIAEIVSDHKMPPWKAEAGYGEFVGERRLTDSEIATIVAWSKAGAPEGDPKDAGPAPEFVDGWRLGEPDLVIEAPHEVTVPADGPDVFHHFVVPVGSAGGRDVVAVEFRPGNPRVVHHAVIVMDETGTARARDKATEEPGFSTTGSLGAPLATVLTLWAPGVAPRALPAGVAIHIPEKSDIVVQLHLHPSGKVAKDRSRLGIYFAKSAVTRRVIDRPFIVGPVTLDIPAGAKQFPVEASTTTPVDLWMTAVLPHMHLLGREIKVCATLPSGEERPLVWIRDWDFNWQDQYVYCEPVFVPAGSTVRITGVYDNSADNPANPRRPPERVMFGEETNDEMCLAIFQAYANDPTAGRKIFRVLAGEIFSQMREPTVTPEVRARLKARLSEFGRAELEGKFRERAASLIRRD